MSIIAPPFWRFYRLSSVLKRGIRSRQSSWSSRWVGVFFLGSIGRVDRLNMRNHFFLRFARRVGVFVVCIDRLSDENSPVLRCSLIKKRKADFLVFDPPPARSSREVGWTTWGCIWLFSMLFLAFLGNCLLNFCRSRTSNSSTFSLLLLSSVTVECSLFTTLCGSSLAYCSVR